MKTRNLLYSRLDREMFNQENVLPAFSEVLKKEGLGGSARYEKPWCLSRFLNIITCGCLGRRSYADYSNKTSEGLDDV